MTASVDNLFARDGFFWWVGVVEDRMDPLKLGRCRVRILGYHVDNKQALPTADLPWAMPMQPIFSAAISGKGQTPLGPLEGTWVVGFFADGKDMQQPIMMGTMGGIASSSNTCTAQSQNTNNTVNAQRDSNGNIVKDQNGNAIPVEAVATNPTVTVSNSITGTLPPLSQSQIQNVMDAIAQRESSSIAGGVQNYDTVNSIGYVGKYQFGAPALQTLGYIKPKLGGTRTNADLNDPNIWTGQGGVNNLDDFLANKNNVQENAMYANMEFNYSELKRLGVIDAGTSTNEQVAGYLTAAHLKGAGGAKQLSLGKDGVDGYGTQASSYYQLGAAAIGGTGNKPVAVADRNTTNSGLNTALNLLRTASGALNNPKLGQPDAFSDPNSVYPKCEYTHRADTNKLATNNDDLKTTPKPVKDANKIDNVDTANHASGSWKEPPSAYAAKYPYNHVKETESGHVIELDDTPNAERIHIYHKSGTYVEIDREGSVSYKVMGENYNIFTRNNRIYTQGNMDVTVDGANTLLVKNTLDVEVLGKTTINIKNDADLNVSGTFNIKAQNLNIETQQDLNIRAGNYFSNTVGGDLSYTVSGDEHHRASGDINMDASDINLNSGAANPTGADATGLDDGVVTAITAQGFAATGLTPLPVDIANPQNSFGKGLSGLLGGFGTGGLGLLGNALSNPAIANAVAGFGSAANFISSEGLGSFNQLLNGQGFGNLDSIIADAGLDLNSLVVAKNTIAQTGILDAIKSSGLIPAADILAGENIINNFYKYGASTLDVTLPVAVASIKTDATEFASWTDFPDSAQLSKYFNLGDVSSRVQDVSSQFKIQDQVGLSQYDIITNLKALSVNVLDTVYERYPNMQISNAFRPAASYLSNLDENNAYADLLSAIQSNVGADAAAAVQQQLDTPTPFEKGQAVNLHFKGASAADYYEIAQWIKNNVAYDQVRLEYSTLGSSEPWITVTHNPAYSRDVEAFDKVITSVNGQVVANYLVDLSSA